VGEPEENRLREMYMLTCENKVERRLKVLGYGAVDWIQPADYGVYWRHLMNTSARCIGGVHFLTN
jgi:hypothetical protein